MRDPEKWLSRSFLYSLGCLGALAFFSGDTPRPKSNVVETTALAISRTIWCMANNRWEPVPDGSQISTSTHIDNGFVGYDIKAVNHRTPAGRVDQKNAIEVKVDETIPGHIVLVRFANLGPNKYHPNWVVDGHGVSGDPEDMSETGLEIAEEAYDLVKAELNIPPIPDNCRPSLSNP